MKKISPDEYQAIAESQDFNLALSSLSRYVRQRRGRKATIGLNSLPLDERRAYMKEKKRESRIRRKTLYRYVTDKYGDVPEKLTFNECKELQDKIRSCGSEFATVKIWFDARTGCWLDGENETVCEPIRNE